MIELGSRDKQKFREHVDASFDTKAGSRQELARIVHESFTMDRESYLPLLTESRAAGIEIVVRMARDRDWQLPRLDRKRVGGTLGYVAHQLVAGAHNIESTLLGFLAIDLMLDDCHAELQMYADFAAYRDANAGDGAVSRTDWLQHKREQTEQTGKRRILGMRRSRLFRGM